MKPTHKQIKKFLEHLHNREMFYCSHFGDVEPNPDLVAVIMWLTEEAVKEEEA